MDILLGNRKPRNRYRGLDSVPSFNCRGEIKNGRTNELAKFVVEKKNMSPVKTPAENLKAKSPSKVVQTSVDNSWGKQTGTENPKQALAQKSTKNPYPVSGAKK